MAYFYIFQFKAQLWTLQVDPGHELVLVILKADRTVSPAKPAPSGHDQYCLNCFLLLSYYA